MSILSASIRPKAAGLMLTVTGLLALSVPLPVLAQQAAHQRVLSNSRIWNAQERAAAEVVEAWIAAWNAQDAQKAADLMSVHCEFRGDVSENFQRGRAPFIRLVGGFLPTIKRVDLKEIYAIGGPTDTTVFIRRIDVVTFPNSDKPVLFPVSAYFRVKNGKIQEWLDTPIDANPAALPPPPKGPAAPGNAPPSPPNNYDCAQSSCE